MDIVDCYLRLLGLCDVLIWRVDADPSGQVVRVLPCDYADEGRVLSALLLPDVGVVLRLRVDLVGARLTFQIGCGARVLQRLLRLQAGCRVGVRAVHLAPGCKLVLLFGASRENGKVGAAAGHRVVAREVNVDL